SVSDVRSDFPDSHAAPALDPTTAEACSKADATKALAELQPYFQQIDDAVQLANSTPRISLAPVINQMQSLRRNIQAENVPNCATATKSAIVANLNDHIQGTIDFEDQASQ